MATVKATVTQLLRTLLSKTSHRTHTEAQTGRGTVRLRKDGSLLHRGDLPAQGLIPTICSLSRL